MKSSGWSANIFLIIFTCGLCKHVVLGLKFWPCYLLAVWPWASDLTSLYLRYLIWKQDNSSTWLLWLWRGLNEWAQVGAWARLNTHWCRLISRWALLSGSPTKTRRPEICRLKYSDQAEEQVCGPGEGLWLLRDTREHLRVTGTLCILIVVAVTLV